MINPLGIYEKIKSLQNPIATKAAEVFMNSLTKKYTEQNPAPPEEIQKGLEGILAEHQPKPSGVSHSSPKPYLLPSGNMRDVHGLATIAALIIGGPYLVPYFI